MVVGKVVVIVGILIISTASDLGNVSNVLRNGPEFATNRVLPVATRKVLPEGRGGNFEGDMVLTSEQLKNESARRNALTSEKHHWPIDKLNKVVVPVEISKEFKPDQADMMKRVFSEIERDTCITFIERTNQRDYIKIVNGNGCNSNVGKVGGVQNITLQIPECLFKGNILHNLMHSLGFHHMISSSDRDKYVRIIEENIVPELKSAFNKKTSGHVSYFGTQYDFNSIMQFHERAFSKNGKVTIETINPANQKLIKDKKTDLSDGDVDRINTMYKCPQMNKKVTKKPK